MNLIIKEKYNTLFDDPIKNKQKYLFLEYINVNDITNTVMYQENEFIILNDIKKITLAKYGNGKFWNNVLNNLKNMLNEKTLNTYLCIFDLNKFFGDPCFGKHKKFNLEYINLNDSLVNKCYHENEYIYLSDIKSITKSIYGNGKQTYNVTNKCIELLTDENTIFSINNIKLHNNNKNKFKLISTVGWNNVCEQTFHSQCDWCIGTRRSKNLYINKYRLPKSIFLKITEIDFFISKILNTIPINHKFILIIGDEDATFPKQIDSRYKFHFTKQYDILQNDIRIDHIFATHLDIKKTNKISPFPVGFNPSEHKHSNIDALLNLKVNLDILNKPLKIKGCCRIRGGNQWNDRKTIKKLAESDWSSFSDWGNIKQNFFNEIQKYSFIYCGHGGGLEPNPKVFSAIYCGTIPIIKRFINCELLYKDLPVVIINDWTKNEISINKLKLWRENFKKYFYDKAERNKVVYKLTVDYWKDYIKEMSGYDI